MTRTFLVILTVLSFNGSKVALASVENANKLYAERVAEKGNSKAKEAADLLKPLVDQGNVEAMLPYIKALYFSAKYNMPKRSKEEKVNVTMTFKEIEKVSSQYLEKILPGSKDFINQPQPLEKIILKGKEVRSTLKDVRGYAEALYYRSSSMDSKRRFLLSKEDRDRAKKRIPELMSNLLFCAELDADAGIQGCYRVLSPALKKFRLPKKEGETKLDRRTQAANKKEMVYNYLASAYFNSLGESKKGVSQHPDNTIDYAFAIFSRARTQPEEKEAIQSRARALLENFIKMNSAWINKDLVPEIEAKKIEAKKKLKGWK